MRLVAALLCLSAVAHANPSATSKPSNDLELTASIEPATFKVSVSLHNTGSKPIKVRSHVEAGDRHYDPFTILLEWPSLENKACTKRNRLELTLLDNRKKSFPVDETIAPGATLTQTIDVPAWARRRVNNATVLGGGYYKVTTTYHFTDEPGLWNGTLTTPPIHTLALDQAKVDMCKPTDWDRW